MKKVAPRTARIRQPGVQFRYVEPDGLTGRRIASRRKDVHLSQRALAAELRVSVRTLQYYEAGKIIPFRHLTKLSALLGRSPAWLLYGHEQADVDDLLARSRQQRDELRTNLARLVSLRDQLADSAGRAEAQPDRSRQSRSGDADERT